MKKALSLIVLALTMTLASCAGKDAQGNTDENKSIESNSAQNSESAQESNSGSGQEAKAEKLYNWNSIMELPDPIPAEDNSENRMAHNIYVNPDISQTSGQFTGFLIDFCTDCEANCTYWALCNWRMDTSELESEYTLKNTGGAYAGLQNTAEGKKAIMSFWEISYDDENGNEVKVLASRVYPATNKTNTFGGEGEGTNYIPAFGWKKDHWYRMYLNCYDNEEGYTLVEQWVQDIETEEWTEISCFNTGLKHSCFMGAMSQFMENFWSVYSNDVRTFAYRNIYVREKGSNEWTGLTKFKMSSDTWWDNKKGTVAFASDENTLYGITCGYGPDTLEPNSDVSEFFEIQLTQEAHIPN